MEGWPRLEEDLRAPVTAYLRERGYRVRDEVWINGRVADLFAFRDDDTVAIELKLESWRQALYQAMAYQLAALHTYIAMPLEAVPRAVRHVSEFRGQGVGILGVGHRYENSFESAHSDAGPPEPVVEPIVREVVGARPSDRYLPFLAEKIRSDARRPKRVWTAMPRRGL